MWLRMQYNQEACGKPQQKQSWISTPPMDILKSSSPFLGGYLKANEPHGRGAGNQKWSRSERILCGFVNVPHEQFCENVLVVLLFFKATLRSIFNNSLENSHFPNFFPPNALAWALMTPTFPHEQQPGSPMANPRKGKFTDIGLGSFGVFAEAN